ncbi:hypothetical protein [uncultured Bacteroides sp.]|uniref:hypothetical protein n=1 Tax=uncultured Bacteroides sp. TaxID=162156 RepID=UPI0025ECD28E|nr:hypothetical protein [uncultured Bacteroides sp.]
MKKLTFTLCTLLLFGCTETTLTMDESSSSLSGIASRSMGKPSFEFPTIQWSAFETHEQKLAACEIPDSILSNLSTEELVEICMKYPLIFDAYAFNSPLQGIKKVVSRFNGFKELMKRTDNCFFIFKYLKERDIRKIDFMSLSNVEEGRLILLYSLCEYLFSFDDVLKNAAEDLKEEVALFAYDVLETKESNSQHYALSGLTSSMYLWASVLPNNKAQTRNANPTVDKFLETGIVLNLEEYLEIKQLCQTYQ